MTLIPKAKLINDIKHRKFIASLPCLISGADDVQCAHIRKGNVCGVGLKPSDEFTVPLSCSQHRLQHNIGEVAYWGQYGGIERINKLASDLYTVTGDRDKVLELIMKWNNEIYNL